MDISCLKWTKNVKRNDEKWAYPHQEIKDNHFNLHWSPDSEFNANKAQEKDLIILRQKARVTHLVEVVSQQAEKDNNAEGWFYRCVKVIWIANVWSEPPHQAEVFGCQLDLQGGNIMELKNIQALNNRWNLESNGIKDFYQHINRKLYTR